MNGNVAKKLSKLEVKSTTIRGNFSTFSSRICNTEKSCKNVFWKTSHDYFSQYWPLHCKLTSLPYKSERKIEFGGQLRSGIANTDLNSLDHISRKSREQTLRWAGEWTVRMTRRRLNELDWGIRIQTQRHLFLCHFCEGATDTFLQHSSYQLQHSVHLSLCFVLCHL